MTTKLERAARQVIEAEQTGIISVWNISGQQAITALREALAEPVSKCAECLTDNGHQFHCSKAAKFQLNQLAEQAEQDLDTCPRCGGVADNGHDREFPPNPYYCTKCSEQAEQEPVGRWNWNEAKFEWLTKFDYHKHHMTPLYAAPQPVMQEPVAWAHPSGGYLSARYMKEFATGLEKETYTIPLYAATQPVQQEPLMDYERINALREGEQNGAEDAYFFVRPENDTPSLRKMFCQGFERGFHKGLKYASHVRTKDLTDAEVEAIMVEQGDLRTTAFARAVIAAYKEKNK